jgi:uncharacterized repeat protein (TIGR03803 family)
MRCSNLSSFAALSKLVWMVSWFSAATAMALHAQTLTVLANFDSSNGALPVAPLVQSGDGDFYGTTVFGGSSNEPCGGDSGCGTIFKVTSTGILTTLYSFCTQENCPDGSEPSAALVQGADGSYYGTTFQGGTYDGGTVFKITATGTLTTLYIFDGLQNGEYPSGELLRHNGRGGHLPRRHCLSDHPKWRTDHPAQLREWRRQYPWALGAGQ